MPEVEKLLAFQDEELAVTDLQVQTCTGMAAAGGASFTTQVDIPLEQLAFPADLYYVLAIRFQEQWVDFVVISREHLNDLRVNQDVGLEYSDENTGKRFLRLTLSFTKDNVACSGKSFQRYRNAWELLPPLRPPKVQ
jgi:hypothetical protein